ncbi:2-amino-4-hydroxy-6-hydroxymethyldihydropteridine diphosphokinase [Oceanospirillum sanctuarii]|uniref:2-amino-4-hydroxy-6- hydroxymethyldihydropteridine diphosphokinase n=1 Tax=Oceanospirillum sanctuarii TaxID=1434821 RepID=UPI000A3C8626|nr:2-amino-4-hydroxy-6-hydroxymethyldihydropteridine diphosphokinase [Oceanospirillum sanctuarii]
MSRVYLSLGSNIDARSNIKAGIEALNARFGEMQLSPVVESEPVGFVGDPFINLMTVLETELPIPELSKQLRQMEYDFGREDNAPKFSGRTLDIDIVMVDQLHGEHFDIRLPRKDLFEHGYMLYPLALMEPDLVPPGQEKTVQELWANFPFPEQKLWLTEL